MITQSISICRTEDVEFDIEEYIKHEVERFNPKGKWFSTPKSFLENYWGTLEIKNDYYYFHHSWESKEQFGGYFYEKFHGPQQELSNFIKQLYQALDIKYQEYLKQKEENNYKSIVGKIKKLSPKRIEELKEFILNEYGN